MVKTLGFFPPPSDNGIGGDNRYDVYIENIGGYYGITTIESPLSGNQTYSSYISVDDDFKNFYTTGINAAKVTAAHELFHAIQMGNYILRQSGTEILDAFFYELSSTAMEEFVFDEINDYYGYMKSYFNNTANAFASYDGYNLAVWNIFLQKKYGNNIFRRQWDLLKKYRALQSIDISLSDLSTSFSSELAEFGLWTYFTNYRSIPNKYFEEALYYPVVKTRTDLNFTSPSRTCNLNTMPTSNSLIRFVNRESGKNDSLCVIITNSDIQNGINNLQTQTPCQYILSNYNSTGAINLSGYYYRNFSSSQLNLFSISEILNNHVISGTQVFSNKLEYAYPSPFMYNLSGEFIYFPVDPSFSEVDLSIYNISMNLVFSGNKNPARDNNGNWVVKWNCRSIENQKLPSGVYIYSVKHGNNIQKGKVVILNE
jgi:hypothetical protein